jgi:DNA polymerase III delta prime subunit
MRCVNYKMMDLNTTFLEVEIQRIDILIQRALRLWRLAGNNPEDQFLGLYISNEEAAALAGRANGRHWGSTTKLPGEDEQVLSQALAWAEENSQKIIQQARQEQVRLRLIELSSGFDLSTFEYNAFLVCLAPVLDLRYERLYAFLQNDITRKATSANLILDLLLEPGLERLPALEYLHDRAALLKFNLLHRHNGDANLYLSPLRQEFSPSPEIVAWLMGNYRPADEVANSFHLSWPEAGTDQPTGADPADRPAQNNAHRLLDIENNLAFDPAELAEIARLMEAGDQPPILAFYGADQQRQRAAAHQIAASFAQPVLEIDLEACQAAGTLSQTALRLALRDAILNQALPYFTGWDCWQALNDAGSLRSREPSVQDEEGYLPDFILSEMEDYSGPVIVSSRQPWAMRSTLQHTRQPSTRPVLSWTFDLPSSQQRLQLWKSLLDQREVDLASEEAPNNALEALASQFTLSSLQIRDAVWTAANHAYQVGRPVNSADLFQAARQHSAHHLDELAVKLQPRYHWQDIVLPEEELQILKEIASTVRERSLVLETWGLGRKLVSSAGVNALFAGPPGTGKTLAAQVIAAELGMDLYKIDLSTVVSKYIGETEKNLERIFTQAHNSNTILFFDEADAIFGKRSEVKDAHDRYANIEVGYLLQRMETYDGVVILATNLRSNLDDAFIRRLQFVVNFPFPEKAERVNIWKVLMPPEMPCEANIDYQTLADRFELSGGSIRNAIVSAAYLAASQDEDVSIHHLLHGVRRELQKMGRLIDEKDLVIQ